RMCPPDWDVGSSVDLDDTTCLRHEAPPARCGHTLPAEEVVSVSNAAEQFDDARQFNVHEAGTHLSRILERVEHGEEIVISRAGHPVAEVVPLVRPVDRRGGGSLRGRMVLDTDGDSEETNAEIAADFG